jgi:hypothetical protein
MRRFLHSRAKVQWENCAFTFTRLCLILEGEEVQFKIYLHLVRKVIFTLYT